MLQFYVGGVAYQQEGLVVVQNYTGCVENLYLNSTNLFRNVKEAYSYGTDYKYEKVNTLWSCPVSITGKLLFHENNILTFRNHQLFR